MVMGNVAPRPRLPAGSVAVMSRLFRPSASGLVGVALQLLLASTTAVAMTLPAASCTVMVSPGAPVPLRVGVVSLVLLSPWVPLSLTPSSAAAGAVGAVVSMVMGSVVCALVLPTASVAVSLKLCTPSVNAAGAVMDQVPSGPTTVVPSKVVPSGA